MPLSKNYTQTLSHKKILITGVLGFIGRTLAEQLLEYNPEIELFGIDIKNFPNDKNAPKLKRLNYETLDIRDENAIKKYFSKHTFNGIIHLAAISRVVDAERDKINCIKTNYKGTQFIVEEASKFPQTWMIFASSREVYGEQSNFPVSEDMEKLPLNIYGFYKLLGEDLICRNIDKYIILRFSNVYGNEYDIPGRVIPNFVQRAINGETLILEGGDQVIDFTYIDDTVNAIIKSMINLTENKIQKEIIHILPGKGTKLTEIIDHLRHLGFQFDIRRKPKRAYDVEKFIGNPAKRIQILGNDEFVDVEEGLRRLVERLTSLK